VSQLVFIAGFFQLLVVVVVDVLMIFPLLLNLEKNKLGNRYEDFG